MSIAAAENAGLGPCELPLPDQWLVHTQLTSSQQSQQSQSSQSQSQYSSSSQAAASASSLATLQQQSSHSSSGSSSASHPHLQPKIMNAVVPAVSVPAASKKIRRKPDTKPQSQINKCNNEKRRRELENEYIEQLGEFLQINKRDMTACKPDKAAILSEVVRTFRRLLEQGNRDLTTAGSNNRCSKCSPDCSDSCKLHPVQQGEVSSTEPPLPEPSVNGHSPEKSAYFEAVQYYISNIGWALLEINSDGVIECATENVRDVLHYTRTELHGQSIYSYLHTGDHSKLSPILNKNSFELNWDQDEMFCQSPKRTIRTKIRWLLRAPDSANDTIEQKQQRQEKYKDLLIISAQVKDDTDAESSSVLCLITLPEDELNQQQQQAGQLGLPGSVGGGGLGGAGGVAAAIELSSLTMPQTLDEQLTLKLDMNGAIIDLDAATLRKQFAGYLTKEAFRSIHDLCHFQDRPRLNEHLNNVMNANGVAQVSSYRLRLGGPDVYVHVKAQTRLFRNSKANNEPDFIMAIHTILTDSEVAMMEAGAGGGLNNPSSSSSSGLAIPSTSTGGGGSSSSSGGSTSSSRQMQQITQGVSNMGGPLMSSILNGGAGGNGGPVGGLPGALSSVVSPRSNPTASLIPPSDSSNFFNSDFEFEFPHSTFDMESVGVGWDSRPDSRTSVTPVSTPRPPSVTAYSPAAAPMCPSPLTPYHAGSAGGQPSPSNNNNNANNQQVNNNNNNNSMTNNNAGPFGSNFPFPFDDKEKIQEQIHQQQQQQQNQQNQQQQMASHDSERLRNLLTTKRPHSNASSSSGLDMDHDHRNPNRILKLLNEKSDDDDLEGRNRPSELLRQLQKVKDEPKEHPAPLNNEELIQMLRFQGNDRKRPSNEPDEGGAAKRPSDKPSKLCEKNKMLASLLANPAKAPTPLLPGHLPLNRIIPDIPISNVARQMASVTSSTPPNQQTINNNNLTTSNNNLKQVQQLNHQLRLQQQQHQQQLRKAQAMPSQSQQPPTSSDIYLSHQQQQQQHQQQAQAQQQALLQAQLAAVQQRQQNFSPAIQDSGIGSVGSGAFATPSSATSTTSTPMPEWDSELNEILNHVIDIAPEGNFVDSELNSLLGISSIESSTSATPSQSSQQDIQEKLAINAIQKSLMQIENVTSPMQYSGSPPAYPMHGGMAAPGGSPAGGSQQTPTTPNPNFTPPPVYTPRVRMSSTGSSGGGGPGGPSGGQMGNGAPGGGGGPNALTIQKLQNHQQQRERIHQEQQRQRLLQQQKQQQMVVPVNATANADLNLGLTPGIQNIESLLNNTVAPNVSLTRANSVVPDSQLSPGFSPSQLMQQQLSPNQRTQLSPQQTGFQGSPFNNNPVHRMSPQQVGGFPQQQQQQQPGTPGSQQLSPRQPPFVNNPQVSQPNALQQQQQQQWQQNANARLSIQQQNPMLNAQLSTIPGYNPAAAAAATGRQQFVAPQRQRSLNSPGTPRQGSFGGTVDGGGFPGPPSPSQPGQNFNNPAVFAAAQQMRLQRQGSVPPQATQHLPGSPRPSYGGHGPGPDAGGYGMMFSQAAMQQHTAGSPGDFFNRAQTGAGANGGGGGVGGSNGPNAGGLNSSELVRQELRAVVSGRAQNAAAAGGVCGTGGLRTPQSPIGMSPGMVATAAGNGGGGGGNVQGPGSASSGGAGVGGGNGGGIGGNGDSMQTSQLPGTSSSSSSLLHPSGDMDPSMLFNFHLTPKEFFGGNTSR